MEKHMELHSKSIEILEHLLNKAHKISMEEKMSIEEIAHLMKGVAKVKIALTESEEIELEDKKF